MEISSELKKSLLERVKIICTILMDAVFLVAWVLITWGTDECVKRLKLTGLNELTLDIFEVVLGVSTLITVMLFVIKDILTLLAKTWNDLQGLKKTGGIKNDKL